MPSSGSWRPCARGSRPRRRSTPCCSASGLTDAQLRETLRENLRIRAYIEQRFAGAEDEPAG